MVPFPAPVGGVPFEEDFVPSVVFAVIFALIVFLGVYRLARASTRTLLLLGPMAFCIERVVMWSLRAKQAKTPSEETDRSLTIYWQISFAAAYTSLWACLWNLLRCILVATTKGSKSVTHTIPLVDRDQGTIGPATHGEESYAIEQVTPARADRPRLRFWYRRVFGVSLLAAWAPVITGTIMGYNYVNAEYAAVIAQGVETLRYVTTGIALAILVLLHLATLFALVLVREANRRALLTLYGIGYILLILPAYELVVIGTWTTSLTSTAPGSQNTHGEKVVFYVLRAAPEAIVSAIIFALDVRNMFVTGLRGDSFRDPKEKE